MAGSRNPQISRRTYTCFCRWWSRSTFGGELPLSELVHQKQPQGEFYAKPISSYFTQQKEIGGFMRIEGEGVQIESPDDLSKITPDCLVEYRGMIYRVETVAQRDVGKTREFMRNPLKIWILQLQR